jgi:hypothetical protein
MRITIALSFAACIVSPGCREKAHDGISQSDLAQPLHAPVATQSSAVASQPTTANVASRVINPFPDIIVRLEPNGSSSIEITAWTCLEEGLLEQIACSPQTREHESLLVVKAKPSQVHAALLLAGFEPGSPGRWTYDEGRLGTIDPTGQKLSVGVRYADSLGEQHEHAVGRWIRNANPTSDPASAEFPDQPWVFGGSKIISNPEQMGLGEHYVADMSGSLIGLVTFGDEVIGFSRVLADQESVQAPLWEVNSMTVPPAETQATIILRRWTDDR